MVRSGFKRTRYLIAGFITALLFLLGVLMGLVVENKRVSYIQQLNKVQQLDFSSLQLQYQLVDQLGSEDNCPAVMKTFDKSVESLERARIKLESYTTSANMNKEDFLVLQREYTLAQIRYWILAKRAKHLCKADIVTVLYFFSDKKECRYCDQQSFVLTYIKKRLKDKILNFAFDGRIDDEPLIQIMKSTYNVTRYPTIVIEGDIYHGFLSKDEIFREVCVYIRDNVSDCMAYEPAINLSSRNSSVDAISGSGAGTDSGSDNGSAAVAAVNSILTPVITGHNSSSSGNITVISASQ